MCLPFCGSLCLSFNVPFVLSLSSLLLVLFVFLFVFTFVFPSVLPLSRLCLPLLYSFLPRSSLPPLLPSFVLCVQCSDVSIQFRGIPGALLGIDCFQLQNVGCRAGVRFKFVGLLVCWFWLFAGLVVCWFAGLLPPPPPATWVRGGQFTVLPGPRKRALSQPQCAAPPEGQGLIPATVARHSAQAQWCSPERVLCVRVCPSCFLLLRLQLG